ncbi:uncharacterized protein LOC122507308 [Leptopilina heterotoma]|uniref:uncharacterized protein LOC122507308 n=1 Tax=Leptopilina heterotoma TaxID=63436 RepID=UPI001CA89C97|nr:uncharacterized protein LOC122507308 [Leptopilina heterotoma]
MEPNFEELLTFQNADFQSIDRHFKYMDDLDLERRSPIVIRNRCTLVESLWRNCRERHALLTHCANPNQKLDDYFKEDKFGQKEMDFYSNFDVYAELLAELQPQMQHMSNSTSNHFSERYDYVKANRVCTNCLRAQHKNNDCPSKFTCTKCKIRHHTSLHRETKPEPEHDKDSNDNTSQNCTGFQIIDSFKIQSHFAAPSAIKSNNVLLAIARVWVLSPLMRAIRVRALIDQGSTWTFASRELAKFLNSKSIPISASLTGVGGASAGNANSAISIGISSNPNGNPVFNTQALVIPKITSYVPQSNINFEQWSHLKNLNLADDPYNNDPIHLLIGAELYGSLISDGLRKGKPGEIIAQNTIFGWVLSRSLLSVSDQNESSVQIHHCITNKSLDSCLQMFWEIDEVNSKEIMSIDDELCEEHFQKTHSRKPDGQYSVSYPFTTDKPINIGHTKQIAEKSLKRLDKNPVHEELYSDFMEKYETLHDMKKVESLENPSNQIVYIPHQPVFRETSITTRMRAVFHASTPSTNGTSLNDHMRVGQKLQPNLFIVLIHWRVFKYVYTADIARMYRQILINLDDVDYQRIFWRLSPDQPISEYQLLTVTYGTRSAPYLALRVLKQLVIDEGSAFPLASYVLNHNIYIDDAMFGGSSKREAKEIRDKLLALLGKAHFTPKKWASNSPLLLSDIDPHDHGLAWSSPLNDEEAKMYDPVGWLSPIIISGKIIMQNLWRKQCSWDESLDNDTVATWIDYVNLLNYINELTIPRWLNLHPDNLDVQIHGFADALETAYGAVLYLRVTLSSHEVITQIITSKTKVAPVKQISIQRLELQGATLLSRLVTSVCQYEVFSNIPIQCWTDSTIVLSWLNKHPSHWHTYVANRISEIQTLLPDHQWRHTSSQSNPADLASRGVQPQELIKSNLWWNGPEWLSLSETHWPPSIVPTQFKTNLESKGHVHLNVEPIPDIMNNFASRYSSSDTDENIRFSNPISAKELSNAEIIWYLYNQGQQFQSEIHSIKINSQISQKSKLRSLTPFLDNQGLLRVGGRLDNSDFAFEAKHPILFENHFIVKMLIWEAHEKTIHGGLRDTLSYLRQTYWIIHPRPLIKSILHKCVTCVKL